MRQIDRKVWRWLVSYAEYDRLTDRHEKVFNLILGEDRVFIAGGFSSRPTNGTSRARNSMNRRTATPPVTSLHLGGEFGGQAIEYRHHVSVSVEVPLHLGLPGRRGSATAAALTRQRR
jgi:hypothetical protein